MKNVNKNWKNWVFRFTLFCCSMLALIGVTNFIVDPLWLFGNNGWWNKYREGFDERRLKTNYLPYVIDEIDGILIGSSMSRTVSTKDLNGLIVYNYACSGLLPDHSAEFIRHTISEKGGILTVFIGLDLFNTVRPRGKDEKSPQFYIDNAKQKFKEIFSIDSFGWAIKSIIFSTLENYAYSGFVFIENFPMPVISQDLDLMNIYERAELTVADHLTNHKNYTASYLEKLKETIIDLDIQPVFYITPVTKAYLVEMIKIGAYPVYERFMRDVVNIFDPIPIWNFMYINSVTVSDKYFYDPNHTNDRGGRAIAHRISGGHDYPADFGILVSRENLEDHIRFLRRNVFEALSAYNN